MFFAIFANSTSGNLVPMLDIECPVTYCWPWRQYDKNKNGFLDCHEAVEIAKDILRVWPLVLTLGTSLS